MHSVIIALLHQSVIETESPEIKSFLRVYVCFGMQRGVEVM